MKTKTEFYGTNTIEMPFQLQIQGMKGYFPSQISIKAYIYQDEAGEYCAEVPAFSGCISGGTTFEEAAANIREAAELWLECSDHIPEGVPSNAKIECVAL